MRLQQPFVEGNGFLQLQTLDARVDPRRTRGLIDFDLQVAETPHRFGAHLLVLRLQLEEVAVLLDRLLRLHIGRRIGRDPDFLVLEVLDRGRGLRRAFLVRRTDGCGAERAGAGDRDDQYVA